MIKGTFLYQNPKCNKSLKQGRKFEQCFVWKTDEFPIYIMDNHRAALWCWLQHNNTVTDSSIGLLHIDNHPDMSPYCNCASQTNFTNLGIDEYLDLKHLSKEKCEFEKFNKFIFSNQNFLSFFISNYPEIININDFLITLPQHKKSVSTIPVLIKHLEDARNSYTQTKKFPCPEHVAKKIDYKELIKLLNKLISSGTRWIIDLDLDFFFKEKTGEANYKLAHQIFILIKKLFDVNKVITLTVAWSPEYLIHRDKLKNKNGMYGWKKAKRLNDDFCQIFGIDTKDFKKL